MKPPLHHNRFLAVLLVLLLGACEACSGFASCPARGRFQLHIFEDDLELGQKREPAWTRLKRMNLGSSALVYTEDDIEVYDWEEQVITFTVTASDRVNEVFTGSEYASANLDERVFIATFDGDFLYGGIFLGEGSEMPVEYPVIYVWTYDGAVTFTVRPSTPGVYAQLAPSYKSVIENQDLHDFLKSQGKLTE